MEEDSKPRAIERRTSRMEAQTVIDNLSFVWSGWDLGPDDTFNDFFRSLREMEEGGAYEGIDAGIGAVRYSNADSMEVGMEYSVAMIWMLAHACIYTIKATKEKEDSPVAWMYLCQAHQNLGFLQGIPSGCAAERKVIKISDQLKQSAEAARRANRRWDKDPFKVSRERAKQMIKDALSDWRSRPELYTSDASFAYDISNKIDTDEKGKPVYSADYIAKKLIKSGEV